MFFQSRNPHLFKKHALIHYSVEIAFYSLAGPVVTWLTLIWVEHRLVEKEALEYEVQTQERHLASLTNASADAILSLDDAGHIISWNRGAERLFGYTAQQIIGQPLSRLIPDSPRLFDRLQQNGVVQNFETTVIAHNGRRIIVNLTQTLLAEDNTKTLSSSLIMRDVTSRRERDAILEEDRARIARDLHDGVAQILYLLALKADIAAGQIAHDPGQVEAELKEIGRRSRQVIREVRRTIFALRPLDWSSEGFLPALRGFVKDFAEHLNWQASFRSSDDNLVIPDRLQPTVFRLVQESLNNVAKHATAKQVWIDIEQVDERSRLSLSIRDDGLGFNSGSTSGRGMGLQQMKKRAEAVGGTFSIHSQANSGTTITAQIPL